MVRHNPSILLIKGYDQSELIELRLADVCKNLLERPAERRGPFDIPDNELKVRLSYHKPLKLAAG